MAKSKKSGKRGSGKRKLSELADEFESRHKHFEDWTFHFEYPGYFAYSSKKWPTMVFFTPDFDGADGFVVVQVDDGDGTILEADDVPYRRPLDADQLMQIVKPYLKKYKLVDSVLKGLPMKIKLAPKRKGNPVDGQIVLAPVQPPPPPSGATSIFKVAAGVAVVGLVGAGLYKFFTRPVGTLVIDHKEPKPVDHSTGIPVEPPTSPLAYGKSKILAKLPAFDPAATGTVPYYVVNVFADVFANQELTRPEPGAGDIATYLRSAPVRDIDVFGPFMPGQKPDRFEGPLPDLAVIVAPNGMVITSMNKADLAAITPAV